MGREIKRVALDFNWPQNMIWKGFLNPYHSQKCIACDQSGYNPETKKLADDWYDFGRTGRRWCDAITQDEVQALVDNGRLRGLTHDHVPGKDCVEKEPHSVPTAVEVNRLSRIRGVFLHDAINKLICVETRAKRLGVWGTCPVCQGNGELWFSDKCKALNDAWYEDEQYEPPSGDGWQVWETVSEGSPVSPVFATAKDCVDWLIGQGYSKEAADNFVNNDRWAPSIIVSGGAVYKDIESCACKEAKP